MRFLLMLFGSEVDSDTIFEFGKRYVFQYVADRNRRAQCMWFKYLQPIWSFEPYSRVIKIVKID